MSVAAIVSVLLPMVVTFLLGGVAAWSHDFGPKDGEILNRMVLRYAVPLTLFAGTVTVSRAELAQDTPLMIALCVAIIGLYAVVLLLFRIVLRQRLSTSALAALISSTPAAAEMGPAILGDLFAGSSAIPIAIAGLIIVLIVLPVTILLMELDARDGDSHSASYPASRFSVVANKLVQTVKQPIVWAPVFAFIIVLIGGHIPQVIVRSLFLLGHASGGVALFASGIVLASGKIKVDGHVLLFFVLKNILQPALVLGGLRALGYSNPIVREAVLTTAIPTMPIVVMLALKYRIAEAQAASAVFLSVIGAVITMGIFMALTS